MYFKDSKHSPASPLKGRPSAWTPRLSMVLLLASHGMVAAVATNGNWNFRLGSVGATSGVLEARPNSSVPWGIVCDDGFNTAAANAACRSLSLPTVNSTFRQSTAGELSAASVSSGTTIYMDDVVCSASGMPFLPQCTFLFSDASTTTHNCGFHEAIFVSCSAVSAAPVTTSTTRPSTTQPTTTSPVTPSASWQVSLVGTGASPSPVYSGLLRVRPNPASEWGPVCDDGFGALEAAAACRSVFGPTFSTGIARTSTISELVGYTYATLYMDDVRCNGTASAAPLLPECAFIESTSRIKRNNCQPADAVFLSCTPPPPSTLLPRRDWQVSFPGEGTEGLLRVRPDASAPWGTVCDDGFGALEAAAACRSIFSESFSDSTARTSTVAERSGYSTATMYMDDVVCGSGGYALAGCNFIESTPTITRHNCSASQAVYVSCVRSGLSPSSSLSDSKSLPDPGPIIGASIGGVVGLFMLGAAIMCFVSWRRRKLGLTRNAVSPGAAGQLFAHTTTTQFPSPTQTNPCAQTFAYNPGATHHPPFARAASGPMDIPMGHYNPHPFAASGNPPPPTMMATNAQPMQQTWGGNIYGQAFPEI